MCNGDVRIVSIEDETLLTVAGKDLAKSGTGHIQELLFQLKEHSDYTYKHSLNVRDYGFRFAEKLGLGEHAVFAVGHALSLHDIGKLLISGAIVNKAGDLSRDEAEIMAKHPVLGQEIIQSCTDLPVFFRTIAKQAAYSHHEFWNGKGYPNRLKGSAIPFTARITLMPDNLDAMTVERPYSAPVSQEAALAIMMTQRDLYDPALAPVFFAMIKSDLTDPNFRLPLGKPDKRQVQTAMLQS